MIHWTTLELDRLHLFIGKAQSLGVSDIHINPANGCFELRIRHLGLLHPCQTITSEAGRALVGRIKAQAQMNLAESRCAQDGRIEANPPHHRELRVASHPTVHGENIVIRLFAPQQLRRIGQLGLGPETQRRLMHGVQTEEGLILVCGPTGAGKTSTLHALLHEIGAQHCNVMTLEDPVEITLDGALQTDLSQLPKMGFADGLRSLLRQDPDVLLVGEIRDPETAELAVEAAMTGHLVLASLHAADTAGALSRLEMLGMQTPRVLPHLRNLICQRLVLNTDSRRRIPIMQIWTPQPHEKNTATPIRLRHDAVTRIDSQSLWSFNDCFAEACEHGLLARSDRPVWLADQQELTP